MKSSRPFPGRVPADAALAAKKAKDTRKLRHRSAKTAERKQVSYRYRPLFRPASFSTLPRGLKWEYVEAPSYVTLRPDLPRSTYPHGVISTDRALTLDEQEQFDLIEVYLLK